MNLKKTATAFVAFALLIVPSMSLANTYQYVDTSGMLKSTQATSFTDALTTTPDLGVHSGVMLVTDDNKIENQQPVTGSSNTFYQYVDTAGNIQSMNAANATVALATASNIASNSGVVLVTNATRVD